MMQSWTQELVTTWGDVTALRDGVDFNAKAVSLKNKLRLISIDVCLFLQLSVSLDVPMKGVA